MEIYLGIAVVWLIVMLVFASAAYADCSRSGVRTFLLLAVSSIVWPLALATGMFVGIRKLIQYGWSE